MSTQMDMDEAVDVKPILGAIGLGIGASLAVFVATWSLLFAILGYVFAACLTYSVLWVVGYA